MEGNTINSFNNLCRIFEMRIKLDKEKGVKTPLDVLDNYEKYSKKIDAVYNNDFQKQLKPLISPGITLEKEEDRLRRLIRLLEDRLDRRIELEDRFYDATGKYITGLQMIVSEHELEEKRERLSLVSKYLETNKEIEDVTESIDKLKNSLLLEEKKKEEYLDKNKIMEEELYSSFVKIIKDDEFYKDINEEDITIELDSIRGKVAETKETLDITKESVGSLVDNGLLDDYASYIEEAEKNYFGYKNKELFLKIYKLVIGFEDDFKLISSKREKIGELVSEYKELRESMSFDTEDGLLSFEKVLLLQNETLNNEREVLENIVNYTSRIEFKEERLEELNEVISSVEILSILKEYGLVDTYDSDIDMESSDVENDATDVLEEINEDDASSIDNISEFVYDPYRIIEVKDAPKTLNVGLAKLKGESVREKVNKKLNIEVIPEVVNNTLTDTSVEETNDKIDEVSNDKEVENIVEPINNVDTPVWTLPEIVEEPVVEDNTSSVLPVWEAIKPIEEASNNMDKIEEINDIGIVKDPILPGDFNTFWIPVSDAKDNSSEFPSMNLPVNHGFNSSDNFNFPTINN